MVRLAMFIAALALVLTGVSASAYAFTHGHVEAGIAFLWPALALALILGMAAPKRNQT
ncbi:hypothetical protein [Hyphobacterium sp.]|uniref:hypothetical protein n=1 Tax=Hyphobacterium sp. TaxID=2004662 RepID=UPI003BAC6C47